MAALVLDTRSGAGVEAVHGGKLVGRCGPIVGERSLIEHVCTWRGPSGHGDPGARTDALVSSRPDRDHERRGASRLVVVSLRSALLLVALLVAWATPCSAHASDTYRVHIGDRLTINVIGLDEGPVEVTVQPDGEIRAAGLGKVAVAGEDLDEIARRLAAAARDVSGLRDVRVGVSVVEYAPVFISGAVASPGAYAWRPNLTARKLFALAGGAPTLAAGNGPADAVRASTSLEKLHRLRVQSAALRLRRARLVAELDAAETLRPPAGWATALPQLDRDRLLAAERALFRMRRESLQGRLANLERRRRIGHQEIASLERERDKKREELGLVEDELENLRGIIEQGLVSAPRLAGLRREIAGVEGSILSIESSIIEARQRLAGVEQDIDSARRDRRIEVQTALRTVEQDLARTRGELAYAAEAATLVEGPLRSGGIVVEDEGNATSELSPRRFVVVRSRAEATTETILVDADAIVRPGDVVEVR